MDVYEIGKDHHAKFGDYFSANHHDIVFGDYLPVVSHGFQSSNQKIVVEHKSNYILWHRSQCLLDVKMEARKGPLNIGRQISVGEALDVDFLHPISPID